MKQMVKERHRSTLNYRRMRWIKALWHSRGRDPITRVWRSLILHDLKEATRFKESSCDPIDLRDYPLPLREAISEKRRELREYVRKWNRVSLSPLTPYGYYGPWNPLKSTFEVMKVIGAGLLIYITHEINSVVELPTILMGISTFSYAAVSLSGLIRLTGMHLIREKTREMHEELIREHGIPEGEVTPLVDLLRTRVEENNMRMDLEDGILVGYKGLLGAIAEMDHGHRFTQRIAQLCAEERARIFLSSILDRRESLDLLRRDTEELVASEQRIEYGMLGHLLLRIEKLAGITAGSQG